MSSNPRFVLFKGSRHGLGNKLYTLSACIALCRKWNAKLIIDWRSDEGSTVEFADLFQLVGCDDILTDVRLEDLKGLTTSQTAWRGRFNWQTKRVCNEEARTSGYRGHDITEEPALSGIKGALSGVRQGEVLVACGFTQQGASERCLLRHLRLANAASAHVCQRIAGLPVEIRRGEHVGLHIRAAAGGLFAPVDYQKVKQILGSCGGTNIVVCTDLEAEQDRASNELGVKATFLDKWYPRTARSHNPAEPMALHKVNYLDAGMDELSVTYEAICEMYLLSTSQTLIFQPGSTFSKIAVLFHEGAPWRCVPNSKTSVRTVFGGVFRSSLKYTVPKKGRQPRLISKELHGQKALQ